MDINTQFKKGVLELCVLVLIQKNDRYGYELAEAVSEHVEVAEGALYPLLRRLVKDGYCTTYLQESNEGPPRKYYQLTPEGLLYVKALTIAWNEFVKNVGNLIEQGNFPK
ncbi:PadR family transcriptional regulator [Cohnella sp. WQ 127256]|uniref:PadR family transcriptional regulator n=1 Tax=Cohnella sp. WQ 127256 TaxID=2938790 RepID=UPI002119087F|nr:PadR family transcriptional regulator [Cohnella sp. WQ 127256]